MKYLPRLMTFIAVAQKKSFTEAAKHLEISKSAVSQQISHLESELGVRLIHRTTRQLSLTSIGENLLKRCEPLQDTLSPIFNDLSKARVSPKGRFSITYPHSLESAIIMPVIELINKEFPGLEPVLIANDASLDLVEHQIDLAVHIGELRDSTYRALPVGTIKEIFCATPLTLSRALERKQGNTEKKALNNLSLKELRQEKWISTSRHMGIVLVPDIAAKPILKSGRLSHIAKNICGPEWPVYSLHAYKGEKPIHITRFHELLCRQFETK